MIKTRLVLPAIAALAALALLAGCGGGGGESSSTELASVAPSNTSVYVEATLRPTGALKTDVNELVGKVAGIDNVGQYVIAKLEEAASSEGEPVDYQKEIEPWLGEKASVFLNHFEAGNFEGTGFAVQVTETEEAEEFVDKRLKTTNGDSLESATYKGVEYEVDSGDESSIGMVGNLLVFGKDQRAFKEAVDASEGESLADVASYTGISSAGPDNSLADVFVDIGRLVEESGPIDPQTSEFLTTAGIELDEATALASLVPSPDRLEIDLASRLGKESSGAPAAPKLLGSLPAGSVAAFASGGVGKQFGEAVDSIDASGIPGQVPPHSLKSALKQAGINLDQIAASIGDAGVFAEGSSRASLGGALVLSVKNATEAANVVSSVGLLVRANGTPGVTAISGKATGFSVHGSGLGAKPLVVAAKGERIAVAYGLPAALRGLEPGSGASLEDSPLYKEAVAALGSTPIRGFVDGPAALRLVDSLVSPLDSGYREARPYLSKIGYLALGSTEEGGLSQARLIAGLAK
jgi:Protein of unknown function (DUF3352)